jgi:hypothetical protein
MRARDLCVPEPAGADALAGPVTASDDLQLSGIPDNCKSERLRLQTPEMTDSTFD